jgi:glycosyltransferase involved in cell wall biosynthesis
MTAANLRTEIKLGEGRTGAKPGVVVCIPAFNEQGAIAPVILGASKFAEVVLVCDDGSTDLTADVASHLGAKVLVHSKNQGKGAALRTLIEEAKRLGPKVVVTIDADGQHSSEEIPLVAGPVLDGEADVVIGVRSRGGRMPRERVMGNRVLDEATSMKAGAKLEDTQSGFRAYSGRALAALDFTQKGMAVESQTLIDAAKAGLMIMGVPVSITYDGIDQKRNPLAHFSGVLDYILSRTVVDSPLLYLGVPGLIALLVGVAAGFLVVNTFFETHLIAFGTALISAILIITGTIALATALILKFLKVQLAR